ncbi:MAG TPA: dihydrolipoyl dehydrogenase [Terriglobales bacterium]|nr:dihydrolipoyl dehydrogenase [Terriglobales bacterium]
MAEKKDIVIIGGGPGGYLAAMRAAQFGKKVTIVEADRIGGTCINYGCIPTKYLLHQTKILKEVAGTKTLEGPTSEVRLDWARVQRGRQAVVDSLVKGLVFLLEKGKVEIVKGTARLGAGRVVTAGTAEGERTFETDKVIVAAGSRAASLPFLRPDGRLVITSKEALEFPEVPKSLLIVGAGAIGLEIGSIYRRLGAEVTVLEILPGLLPGADREAAGRLDRVFKKQGLKVLAQMRIEAAVVGEAGVTLSGASLKTGAPFSYTGEKCLLAAGRRPNTEGLFAGGFSLELDRGGFIKVDARLETGVPGVYAIGDVIGGKLLAHKAYRDAVVAAENACGLDRKADDSAVPMAVFTEPEFASVGLTEEEAAMRGLKVKSGVFPLQASSRAMTMDATDGLIKVLADETDRVVGAHIVAPGASDMIPVLTMAVARGMTLEELDAIIYIHPSLSEGIGEAALKANGRALHILNS